ncbi:WD repeat-containing protein 20 homolog [Haematobia irritans]|uniref:WD repeat-containing protein 20 homolog n=1 Tax=Haematobia irritans TaxID=7368 RepID=UPI003F4F5111
MATQLDPNVKDDLKTQFITREGTYRLLTLSEYSRPNRVGYTNNQSSPQVRVSIVTLPNPPAGGGSSSLSATASATNSANGTNNRSLPAGNSSSNAGSNSVVGAGTNDSYDGLQSSSSLNGPVTSSQSQYVVPSSMDARLGAGMSMHTMMNGSGGIGASGNGGIDQNGMPTNQVLGGDRICFNFGRELYVYAFRGVKKGAELSKPIDRKFYKGTNPSCHDFNASTATPTGAPLLVGFTTGQIQLVSPQPGPREYRKLYNEDRLIDKTKVTCLKWLPNSPNLFLASHASGHLYLYNENLQCPPTAPVYQSFKMGDGYSILTCKSKSSRNPLYKWTFNTENCCINEFCFSPCGSNLAIVSQDGFLRVFHYDTMELLGIARSYFGGFLCVCWSPDGKYIVVGGEDDLVTVWSFHERRVVARGQGHRSWVSVVAFDPYTTSYTSWDGGDFSDDENQILEYTSSRYPAGDQSTANGYDSYAAVNHDKNSTPIHSRQRPQSASFRSEASSLAPDKLAISYRLGSVSQDTQICLWDITEDILRHPLSLRQRVNSSNLNDTSFMNGGTDVDGVKVIRPVAIGHPNFPQPQHCSSPTKEIQTNTMTTTPQQTTAGEQNSNSSSSKFSTANCTISSQSSNANTPPEDNSVTAASVSTKANTKSYSNATVGGGSGATIKFPNCITTTKSDSVDSSITGNHINTFSSSSGYNSKTSNSSKSSDSGISAFNSLTQRLSNLSFLNTSDKKSLNLEGGSTRQNRRTLSLLKSYNHHNSSTLHQHMANSTQIETNANSTSTSSHSFGSLKLGKSSSHQHHNSLSHNMSNGSPSSTSNSIITSYDPLKLIGTPACPRFDECPLLEPLVCKKIAHERLSALIFREDCFLTACQDGFIYTWARPGYSTNVPQHLSPTQTAPPGGTVI